MIYMHWFKLPIPNFDIPEIYGFPHNKGRNIRITTADNVTLGAWHFMPTDYYADRTALRYQADAPKDDVFDKALSNYRYDTVVYFHGNAMNRIAPWRVDFYKTLSSRYGKLNIVAIDYRGFGDSEGTPSEQGLSLDAQAVIDWLRSRGVNPKKITLIGHSLGTGVATTLAYDMTKQGTPPKALILKAPYSSLPSLIFEYRLFQYLPVLAPLKTVPIIQNWMARQLQHRFDSLSKIEHVKCPILIAYGASDFEIPGSNSHQLFHQALYGIQSAVPFTEQWLETDHAIQQTVVPNEAIVYKGTKAALRTDVKLLRLKFAGHNNVAYYDFLFEAMADVAGWRR